MAECEHTLLPISRPFPYLVRQMHDTLRSIAKFDLNWGTCIHWGSVIGNLGCYRSRGVVTFNILVVGEWHSEVGYT